MSQFALIASVRQAQRNLVPLESAEKEEANVLLDQTIDKIRQLYGYKAIVRGYSKKRRNRN